MATRTDARQSWISPEVEAGLREAEERRQNASRAPVKPATPAPRVDHAGASVEERLRELEQRRLNAWRSGR